MDPALKAGLTQSVAPAVDTGGSGLPDANRQVLREAIGAAVLSSSTGPQSGPATSTERTSGGALLIPEIVNAIIRQTGHSLVGHNPNGVGRNHYGSDPFMEAIQRLGLHGALPAFDGQAPLSVPPSNSLPAPWQRAPSVAEHRERGCYQPVRREREARQSKEALKGDSRPEEIRRDEVRRGEGRPEDGRREEARREEPRKRDVPEKERPTSDKVTEIRAESPAEQRVREVLEKAVARFQERAPDLLASLERPSPSLSTGTTPPERSTIPTAPLAIQPDGAGRTCETLLSPAIRDALNAPRNDTARMLQQILASDRIPTRPLAANAVGSWADTTTSSTLSPSLVEARASIQDRLTQLRDALQTTIERSSPQPAASPDRSPLRSQAAAQQGDFTRVEPTRRHTKLQATVLVEERAVPHQSHAGRIGTSDEKRPEPDSRLSSSGGIRHVGEPRSELTPPIHDKANSLLDALSKAAQKIVSLQTLRRFDYAAETAVITVAAAIALGVMGSDIALKELIALSRELLKRLRGEKTNAKEQDDEGRELEAKIEELEMAYADRGVEAINQPSEFVADIPGIVKDDSTGLPLEGIEIDGGSLGTTYTNGYGAFIFKNVPLDSAFALTAKNKNYSFFPSPAIGTVSPNTKLTIFARKE